MGPKIGPWWHPCYCNYNEGPISGDRFLDPKIVLQGRFFRPRFWGRKFHPKCAEIFGAAQKHIHQNIHPESPSPPHLDVAVADHAPRMATSSSKMPIKAHLLPLVLLQKTACASELNFDKPITSQTVALAS